MSLTGALSKLLTPFYSSKKNTSAFPHSPSGNKERAQRLSQLFCSDTKSTNALIEKMMDQLASSDSRLTSRRHSLKAGMQRIWSEIFDVKALEKKIESVLLAEFSDAELSALYTLCQTEAGCSALLKLGILSQASLQFSQEMMPRFQPKVNKLLEDELGGKISFQFIWDTAFGTATEFVQGKPKP